MRGPCFQLQSSSSSSERLKQQPTHTPFLPLTLSPAHLFSSFLHTSSINHSTLNSDWRHSQGLALLAMLPSEYNSRPFCLPKWTLRGSSSLSKDPQITSEKGWVMGGCCMGWRWRGRRTGGRWVTGKWLGRSAAPGELCTLSLWRASNAISHCLATSGFGWTEWKTPEKGKRKKRGKYSNPSRKGTWFANCRRHEASDLKTCSCEQQKLELTGERKEKGALQALAFSDNKTSALHTAKLYKQYKANTCVNHCSQHRADRMTQCVTAQKNYFLVLWSQGPLCLCKLVCDIKRTALKRCV